VSRSRLALLGGVAFFVLWFVAGQVLFFATGGTLDDAPRPAPSEFRDVVMSNEPQVQVGATLLVLAAAGLLWFAGGLRDRIRSEHGLGLVPALGAAGIALLLVLQAGLVLASVGVARESPATSWTVFQLSSAVGFESFITALLGAVTVAGVIANSDRNTVSRWFWWLSALAAAVLAVAGTLEGLRVIPNGRFSILFGLWVVVAALALQRHPTPEPITASTQPAENA
jgi:hypothetical protein